MELVDEFKGIFTDNVSVAEYPSLSVDGVAQFPQDPMVQLRLAIEAVFGSGTILVRCSTARRTRSPTIWEPPSTFSPWCSATRGKHLGHRASLSRAIPLTARRSSTATIWSTPRAKTSSPAFATPAPSPI